MELVIKFSGRSVTTICSCSHYYKTPQLNCQFYSLTGFKPKKNIHQPPWGRRLCGTGDRTGRRGKQVDLFFQAVISALKTECVPCGNVFTGPS